MLNSAITFDRAAIVRARINFMKNQIELESKIAFQEMAVEKLQQTVFDLQAMVEKLEKSQNILRDRLESFANGENAAPINQKPPHY